MASVKAKLAIAIGVCGILGGAQWYFLNRPADLPRIRLPDGGEFRVVQVTYTPDSSVGTYEHNIGAAPKYRFQLWRTFLRRFSGLKPRFISFSRQRTPWFAASAQN